MFQLIVMYQTPTFLRDFFVNCKLIGTDYNYYVTLWDSLNFYDKKCVPISLTISKIDASAMTSTTRKLSQNITTNNLTRYVKPVYECKLECCSYRSDTGNCFPKDHQEIEPPLRTPKKRSSIRIVINEIPALFFRFQFNGMIMLNKSPFSSDWSAHQ